MRQHRQDPLDVPLRGWASVRSARHSLASSFRSSTVSRASSRGPGARRLISSRRDSRTAWRRHLRISTAGMPATTVPGSTEVRAADLAATCTPVAELDVPRRPPPAPPARRRCPAGCCRRCRPGRKGYSAGRPARCARPGRGCRSWCRRRSGSPPGWRGRSCVLAPISTSVLDHHPADLRHLVVGAAVGGVAEAVGPQHHAGVDDARRPRPRCRRRARREDGAPRPPPPRSRGRWRRRRGRPPRRRSGCRRRSRRRGRRGRRGRPRSRAPGSPWDGPPARPALGGMEHAPAAGPARRTDRRRPAGPGRGPAPARAGPTSRAPAALASGLAAVAGVFRNERSAGPAASRERIASTARSGSPSTRPPTSSASSASR